MFYPLICMTMVFLRPEAFETVLLFFPTKTMVDLGLYECRCKKFFYIMKCGKHITVFYCFLEMDFTTKLFMSASKKHEKKVKKGNCRAGPLIKLHITNSMEQSCDCDAHLVREARSDKY